MWKLNCFITPRGTFLPSAIYDFASVDFLSDEESRVEHDGPEIRMLMVTSVDAIEVSSSEKSGLEEVPRTGDGVCHGDEVLSAGEKQELAS